MRPLPPSNVGKPSGKAGPGSGKKTVRSVDELVKEAEMNMVPHQYTIKKWCTTAVTLLEKADESRLMGDEEVAFVLLLRGISVALELIPKHPDFASGSADAVAYRELRKNLDSYVEVLETLRTKLNDRYLESGEKQPSPSVDLATPPSSTGNESPGFVRSRVADMAKNFSRNTPSPKPEVSATLAQRNVITSKPEIHIHSPVPTRNAPASISDNPFIMAQKAKPEILEVVKPDGLVNPFVQKQAANIPVSPSIQPTGSPSQIPKTQQQEARQSPRLPDDDKRMTPAELMAGLDQIIQQLATITVLLLDVRPMEDYIQGHITWKKTHTSGSGLVLIEPYWIDARADLAYLKDCLKGFNDNPESVRLFENMNNFDLVIVYDENSFSWDSTATLQNLRSILTRSGVLKQPPVLLSGGFTSWSAYVIAGFSYQDWIQIGDGTSVAVESTQPQHDTQLSYQFMSQFNSVPLTNQFANPFSAMSTTPYKSGSTQFDNPFVNFAETPVLFTQSSQSSQQTDTLAQSNAMSLLALSSYPSISSGNTPLASLEPPRIPPKSIGSVSADQLESSQRQSRPLVPPTGISLHQTSSAGSSPTAARKPPPPPPKPKGTLGSLGSLDSLDNPSTNTSGSINSNSTVVASSQNDFVSFSHLGSDNIGLTGLKNLGNTCYMASILQCLAGTIPFVRYILGGNYRRHINRSNPLGSRGAIVEAFAELIKSMWNGQDSVIAPKEFKDRIGEFSTQFQGSDQQDSQEFLLFLLDSIHEDMNIARRSTPIKLDPPKDDENVPDAIRQGLFWNYYKASNWSIVVDLFQGQLKSRLECLTCQRTSTTFNTFMYLSVPIPETDALGNKGGAVYLDECLNKFVEPEILDGDDAWLCPHCKVKRRARKVLSIARVPPVLLVHLKRFYHQGPFKNKIETFVDFPVHGLDLARLLPSHQVYPDGSNERKEPFVYDLYSVSNHSGTLSSGHYTAKVLHRSQNQWYNFDDSRISVVNEQDLKSISLSGYA
ncbi:ubiquitin-specific protease doa4 [Blyttiomyces sp. JEL0837]|nr:ubiquitin-specific protease doa4 [Blyttiomyces sp. JEL0837]